MLDPQTTTGTNPEKHEDRQTPNGLPGPYLLILCLWLLLPLAPAAALEAVQETTTEGLSPLEHRQVSSAMALALKQLDRKATCKTLFQVLGKDGKELLQSAQLRIASTTEQRRICDQQPAALFTSIGGRKISFCDQTLDELDRSQLATLLIHEALHMAGVGENPPLSDAPTSRGLTQLVQQSCFR